MNKQTKEVLDILQEECAEVIQAVSKINRFGLTGTHPDSTQTNIEHLEEELGDMLAMIDILIVLEQVQSENLLIAKNRKIDKLKKWSTVYEQD